ncbi:COPI associated protein-domain-containing protein [Xylaria flabelliformis]|nr:COPI associated protein-domain-containing protein [Xylaria flabelliformis]
MDFSDSFRIVNLVVGVVMILGGISQFFNADLYVFAQFLQPTHPSISTASRVWLRRHRRDDPRRSWKPKGALHTYIYIANLSRPQTSHAIILGVYVIIFGACVGLLEFQIPPQVSRYASFMFSFIGRGIFYIFIGSILLSDHWTRYVAGSIIGLTGVAYAALEFVPSIEPPANMREADQGWGAEQV